MTLPMTALRTAPTPWWRISAPTWLALAFVAVFAYFDWIMHRELATTLILAAAVAGVIVFRPRLIAALNLGDPLAAIPRRFKPILAAIPGVAYFLIRGQGTSGSGTVVLLSMLAVVAASVLLGSAFDRTLAPYYRVRNRLLPRPLRMVLAIVLPVLVAFLVIHGSLADLPALFGGTTRHRQNPVGRQGQFFVGTLLSAAVAWLLLRDSPPPAAAAAAVPRAASPATPRPAPLPLQHTWTPTHTTPSGGLAAWAQPSPASASVHVDGGLPVQVVARAGEWAQVSAQNGWAGWVDARLLLPVRGTR